VSADCTWQATTRRLAERNVSPRSHPYWTGLGCDGSP
jgi:hypothetical protein